MLVKSPVITRARMNVLHAIHAARDTQEEASTVVTLQKPVTQTYSLKYLTNFAKATPLSKAVVLGMSEEIPLLVEYKIEEMGYLRYYLAPKIGEEDE